MTKTMSKTKDTVIDVENLLKDGTLTLTATSREEIYKKGETIVAGIPLGTKWTRTIVIHDGQGNFTQTYSLIKK